MFDSFRIALKISAIWPVLSAVRGDHQISRWFRGGRSGPPPQALKARTIIALADQYSVTTLVETGTYFGDTIFSCADRFDDIYSIEVFEPLYHLAKRRFYGRSHIHLLCGDSKTVLADVLHELPASPVLFWLDGHYSGEGTGRGDADTPVMHEITIIAENRRGFRDIILIDDANCFTGSNGYPELNDFLVRLSDIFGVKPTVFNNAIMVAPIQ